MFRIVLLITFSVKNIVKNWRNIWVLWNPGLKNTAVERWQKSIKILKFMFVPSSCNHHSDIFYHSEKEKEKATKRNIFMFYLIIKITTLQVQLLDQRTGAQLKCHGGPKLFNRNIWGPIDYFPFKGCIYHTNKPNGDYFGFYGPN